MTQQNVPPFTWSDKALEVRRFLYQHWCDHGRGPTLRDTHEALGLDRAEIISAYKELSRGEIVFDQTTQNFLILKVPPFSSMPSQVQVWIDGSFHSFAGCAMESVAISRMPPFEDREVRLESYCACCLAPVTVVMRNGELVSRSPESVLIHISKPTAEWGIPTVLPMCDSMNYVLDVSHAERYERTIGRRGVVFTIEQARPFVKPVADNRMWDYHWNPGPMRPEPILGGIRALGVDVSGWDPGSVA